MIEEEKELVNECYDYPESIKNKIIEIYKSLNKQSKPEFPFSEGPRDYQKQAYQNWVKNSYQGIFAMATGTGKTITSLNCVLEEYQKTNYYNILVLVPTRALVAQWIIEAKNLIIRIFIQHKKKVGSIF